MANSRARARSCSAAFSSSADGAPSGGVSTFGDPSTFGGASTFGGVAPLPFFGFSESMPPLGFSFGGSFSSLSSLIVIFFSFWSRAFGRAHLGKIQGAAQTLTVLASAIGPLLLAECVARTGSYAMMFYTLAAVVGMLGISAWFVPLPSEPKS